MITHEGYVYMTPKGSFVRSVSVSSHTQDGIAFVNVDTLNQATLFPSERPPNSSKHQDWSKVNRDRLIPLKAKTFMKVELIYDS